MSPLTMACVAPAAATRAVAADVDDDHLAPVEQRRRAGLGDAVERQGGAVRHGAADDHPVVVGVDQPDLAGHEDAADVEVLAQRVGVEARAVAGSMAWRVSTVSIRGNRPCGG